MSAERTPELEAVYQQYLVEATELILEGNRRLSEVTNKESIFCGPGCSTCCCQVFSVHPVAFDVILNKIENDPLLRQRFENNSTQRRMLIEKYKTRIEEIAKIQDSKLNNLEWIKLRIPCALLHDDKCMIYAHRPYICAAYITLSPPRVCAIDPKGYRPLAIQIILNEFYQALLNLQLKYDMPGGPLHDLSLQLDHRLNPPQEEAAKKKRKKKS